MISVAVIGPDGAGKSSTIKKLETSLALPVKRIYMGIRFESSNIVLPTTRLILAVRRARGFEPEKSGSQEFEKGGYESNRPIHRVVEKSRSILLLLNLFAEEWYRQGIAWYFQRRGFIVLFERHFIADHYAFKHSGMIPDQSPGTRLHGFILNRVYPKPDLVILLDAPVEVFFSRKGEGTLDRLARLREGYLNYAAGLKNVAIVDVTQSKEEVTHRIIDTIHQFLETKAVGQDLPKTTPNSSLSKK